MTIKAPAIPSGGTAERAGKTEAGRDDAPAGLIPASGRNGRLRQLLSAKEIVTAPGVFDCITARLVDTAGFPAVYITGSGVSLSHMGIPDLGMVSFAEVLERMRRIADLVSIPVIADADTGYGGPLNIIRTVRELERAGVSAIQIEDQAWPKKCGHEQGREIVPAPEMVARIEAAVDARTDPDLVIIARTDARTLEGFDAAIERACLYWEAGADVLFVESPESAEELEQIPRRVRGPHWPTWWKGAGHPLRRPGGLKNWASRSPSFPIPLPGCWDGRGWDYWKN